MGFKRVCHDSHFPKLLFPYTLYIPKSTYKSLQGGTSNVEFFVYNQDALISKSELTYKTI